eukprot:208876-Rhodomonas_salina.1
MSGADTLHVPRRQPPPRHRRHSLGPTAVGQGGRLRAEQSRACVVGVVDLALLGVLERRDRDLGVRDAAGARAGRGGRGAHHQSCRHCAVHCARSPPQ